MKDGDLFLKAAFLLNVKNVDPIEAASDASARLGAVLSDASEPFQDIAESINSALTDASEFLGDIANISYLDVKLDATIDFSVEATLAKDADFQVTSDLREISSSLRATLGMSDPLIINGSLDGLALAAAPQLTLNLSTSNEATPFDVFGLDGISKLRNFSFDGSFYGTCLVSVEDLPVDIIFDVSAPDLTNGSRVDFDLSVNLNLVPVADDIGALLDEVDKLTYSGDGPFAEFERFLPNIDLSCIKDSGKAYLGQSNSSLPVSGFFDAIAAGCSENELFELLGGYNASSEELGMNVQLEVTSGRSAYDAVKALSELLSSNGLSVGDEFSTTLSFLDGIEVGGRFFLDFDIGVRGIPSSKFNLTSYETIIDNIDPYFEINRFELEAYLSGDGINMT